VEGTFNIVDAIGDGYSVVSVTGELDVATAPDLRSHLEEAVDRGGLTIADLLGITFIDSTALGALVGSLKRAQAAGGDLRIVAVESRILKIFEITGLTDVFSIFPTVDTAVA
jgi:anti-sigma B factor antagonist